MENLPVWSKIILGVAGFIVALVLYGWVRSKDKDKYR